METVPQPKPCPDCYDKDVYTEWVYQQLGFDITRGAEADRYKNILRDLSAQLIETPLWRTLNSELQASDDEHEIATHERLLALRPGELVIEHKPFDSALLKTWRLNVLEHADEIWPDPPVTGWITPENWYVLMGDLLRTQVLVKYLDGVEAVRDRLIRVANDLGVRTECRPQARDEGYYALHVNVYPELRLPDDVAGGGRQEVSVEIQVSTQVKDVIQSLTHKLYEKRRMRPPPATHWQWNFDDEEFNSNYLGHILHYVEGTIMRLRKMPKEVT